MPVANDPFSPDTEREPSAWRFTLREILISMVAIGAVLALIVNSGPFFASTPSSFFHAVEPRDLLNPVCQRLGVKLDLHSAGSGTNYNGTLALRRLMATIRSPSPSESDRVVAELQQDIEKLLKKHGCEIGGRMTSGNPAAKTLVDFGFNYTKGKTHGTVHAFSLSGSGEHWRLLIILHEFAR